MDSRYYPEFQRGQNKVSNLWEREMFQSLDAPGEFESCRALDPTPKILALKIWEAGQACTWHQPTKGKQMQVAPGPSQQEAQLQGPEREKESSVAEKWLPVRRANWHHDTWHFLLASVCLCDCLCWWNERLKDKGYVWFFYVPSLLTVLPILLSEAGVGTLAVKYTIIQGPVSLKKEKRKERTSVVQNSSSHGPWCIIHLFIGPHKTCFYVFTYSVSYF